MTRHVALGLLALAAFLVQALADPASSVVSGPASLVECGLARFTWAVTPGPIFFAVESNAGSFTRQLPANSGHFDWRVNYTSGTTLGVSVADTTGSLSAFSIFYTVNPGSDQTCLARNVQEPSFVAFAPSALVQCETATISWEGGKGPYALSIFSGVGVVGTSSAPEVFGTSVLRNETSFDWIVDQGAGTSIYFLVQDLNPAQPASLSAYLPSTIVKPGLSSSCLATTAASSTARMTSSVRAGNSTSSTGTQSNAMGSPTSTAKPKSQGQDQDNVAGSCAFSSSQIAAIAAGSAGAFALGVVSTLLALLLRRRSKANSGPVYDVESPPDSGWPPAKAPLSLDLPTPTSGGYFTGLRPGPDATEPPLTTMPTFKRSMSTRAREAFRLSGAQPLPLIPPPAAFLPERPSMSYSHLAFTPTSVDTRTPTPVSRGGASFIFSGSGSDAAKLLPRRRAVPTPSPLSLDEPEGQEQEDEESGTETPEGLSTVEEESGSEKHETPEPTVCGEDGCGVAH